MAILGFDGPLWATTLRQQGPEIAAAVMTAVPTVRGLALEPDIEHRLVVVTCTTRHNDHYGIAFDITEELASLWSGFADASIGLRVHVDALQVDIPGDYFVDESDQRPRRRRWATLARSQLTHQH